MAEFYETGYGKRYYEYQLPELVKQLTRIADALEKSKEPIPGVLDDKTNMVQILVPIGSYILPPHLGTEIK